MILTVTPNPMLDKTIYVESLKLGQVHRAERLEIVAGGKGINVSRALVGLQEPTLATGFLGGHVGNEIRKLLDQEKVANDFVAIAAVTREGFTFVENEARRRTAIFEPGHRLQPREVEKLVQRVADLLPRCRALALCGSMPGSGFDHLYADLIRLAHAAQVPVFLDSYHEPLRLGLAANPEFLKPNREEALNTFGLDARSSEEQQKLLEVLGRSGAEVVFVTDGERPTSVLWQGRRYVAVPPAIECVNALGSGDVLVAAFLYGRLQQMAEEELIRFAVAAGTVNAMHHRPGYANLEEILALAPRVEIKTKDKHE